MLLMTLKEFKRNMFISSKYGKEDFIPLSSGFNLVGIFINEKVYVCPCFDNEDEDMCSKCKDRFICYTNKHMREN